jgi:hypothetical protein
MTAKELHQEYIKQGIYLNDIPYKNLIPEEQERLRRSAHNLFKPHTYTHQE